MLVEYFLLDYFITGPQSFFKLLYKQETVSRSVIRPAVASPIYFSSSLIFTSPTLPDLIHLLS